MLNNFILVGRVVKLPSEENTRKLKVAVTRTYKNTEGIYDTDFIDIILSVPLTCNALDYLGKGDLVGVKGRIETTSDHNIVLIADKLTYLSSSYNNTTTDNNMNKGEI